MVRDYSSGEINKILWNICQDFKEETDTKNDYLEYISALLYIIYFKGDGKLKELYERRNKYYIADEIDDCIESLKNKFLFRDIRFKKIRIYTPKGEEGIICNTIERIYGLVTDLQNAFGTSKKYIAKAYKHVLIQAISNREISLRSGEVYTPTGIAKMMIGITIKESKAEICDPFCGVGNILLNLPVGDNILIFGNEENRTLYNLCMTNLFLHDKDNKYIETRESKMLGWSRPQYDYIISNPPFIDRKARVRENYIDAIIGLPENMFLGTRNSIIVMVLDKNKTNKDILFIDASNEYESNRRVNILNTSNQEKIINTYLKRENIKEFSYVASLNEIKKNEFNLTIKKYISKELKREKIERVEIIKNLRKLEKERDSLEEDIKDVLEELDIKDVFIPYKKNSSIDEVDYELLGKRLREAREKRGYTLYRTSIALNMSPSLLLRIERGYSNIRLDALVKICNFLEVSIEDVLRNE